MKAVGSLSEVALLKYIYCSIMCIVTRCLPLDAERASIG
jgi:hypothetical protein